MASLNTHLRASDHAGLAFHPSCPLCRAERLSGTLADGPVISRRAQAAGLAATVALVPAWAAAPALATDGETTVGTQEPGTPGDSADNPDFKPPPAHKAPLRDGAPVVNTDGPTNDNEGDPLDSDGDSDDPGSKKVAGEGENNAVVPVGPTPETPPPATAPPPSPPTAAPGPAAPAPAAAPAPTPAAPEPAAEEKATPKAQKRKAKKKATERRNERPQRSAAAPAAQAQQPPSQQAPAPPAQRTAVQPAAPTRPAAAPSGPSGRTYRVQAGDSLWSIASRIAGPDASPAKVAALVDQLWKLNSGRIASGDPGMLAVGTALKLP